MAKKQTAVEWFNQQLVDRQNGNGDSRNRDEIFEQALEMEKEQIIKARQDIYTTGNLSVEQYYNETYQK